MKGRSRQIPITHLLSCSGSCSKDIAHKGMDDQREHYAPLCFVIYKQSECCYLGGAYCNIYKVRLKRLVSQRESQEMIVTLTPNIDPNSPKVVIISLFHQGIFARYLALHGRYEAVGLC